MTFFLAGGGGSVDGRDWVVGAGENGAGREVSRLTTVVVEGWAGNCGGDGL